MAPIHVFNKLKWKPPIASKFLKAPELELNLSYDDGELATMPGKQRTVFDGKFKADFDKQFDQLGKQRMKEIQDAVAWTEQRIQAKSKAEMQEVVDTANKLLKQAFDSWQGELTKLCETCVAKAFDASVSAMRKKLQRARVKAICKIVLIAGLVLTAAALSIAATVVTGGALAPLVLGAIATGAGALWKAYKVFDSEWANTSNKLKEVQADIDKLGAAIEAYKKAEKTYAGAADKAKALKAALFAPVNDLDKHVGQLDKYIFLAQTKIKDQKAKLLELASKAKEAKSAEVDSAVRTCIANLDKATDRLKAIDECKQAAKDVKAAYSAQKIPNFGKLNVIVTKLKGASGTVSEVSDSLQTCLSALKELGVPIPG